VGDTNAFGSLYIAYGSGDNGSGAMTIVLAGDAEALDWGKLLQADTTLFLYLNRIVLLVR